MCKQNRKILRIIILVHFFYLLVFIHLDLEKKKSIKARKISRKWETTKKEKSLPSGCFVQRNCHHLLPSPPPPPSQNERDRTLCLEIPLWAFVYFGFTHNFSGGDCKGKSEHIISCFKKKKRITIELLGKSI